MKYYSVEFNIFRFVRMMRKGEIRIGYEFPEDSMMYKKDNNMFSLDSAACWEADRRVENALSVAGVKWKHEYSFHDGSCYKLLATENVEQALKEINSVLSAEEFKGLGIGECRERNQDEYLPMKEKTVLEFMS